MKKKHAKALKVLSEVLDGVEVKAAKPLVGPSADLLKAVTTPTNKLRQNTLMRGFRPSPDN